MDLQNTFYVIGIIYMGIGLILLIALVIAIFAIKAKINAIQRRIEEKVQVATDIFQAGEKIVTAAREFTKK
jgi:hypothetical protein